MSAASEGARIAALLDERSAMLARRRLEGRQGQDTDASRRSFLVCAVGPERDGLPLAALAQVLPGRSCVSVPGAPAALRGIIVQAGAIVSVIDLGLALGVPPASGSGLQGHLVRLRRPEPAIALLVESVLGVAVIASGETESAPGAVGNRDGLGAAAISGYAAAGPQADGGSGGLAILDLPRLLQPFLP